MPGSQITMTTVATSTPFSNTGNGFTANNVQSAIEEAKAAASNTVITYVSDTSNQTTTSASYTNITGMTSTPASGTYLVIFNGKASTSGASAGGSFSIAVAGSTQTDSVRDISCNLVLLGGLVTISVNTIASSMTCVSRVTVNGSQAITAQFKSNTGGTISVTEKNMTIMKVA